MAALPALGLVGPYRERQILLAAIYAMVVAGFNVSFGYGGQLALGQVAVFAGGAYTAAILHSHGVQRAARRGAGGAWRCPSCSAS